MFGQMTAGSWIYIGSQGIVQGTYETFVDVATNISAAATRASGFSPAGLGGMGGAQPLAATMAGFSMLAIECHPSRIEMRLRTGYLDASGGTLDEALAIMARGGTRASKPVSVGLLGNAADVFPEIVRRASAPTSSPIRPRRTIRSTATCRKAGRSTSGSERSERSESGRSGGERPRWSSHVQAMLGFPRRRAFRRSTTATTSARWRRTSGSNDAFDFPGFVPAYIRPLFCRGIGPFRWAALSGNPEDIYKTDAKVKELMPNEPHLHRLARHGAGADPVPGTAGADLLGRLGIGTDLALRSTRWSRAAN